MKCKVGSLGTLFALAALVFPASVFGHGSVYTDVARIDTNPAPGAYTLADQTRHVVTNHGFTMVLRETNGASDLGMVDYSRLPGDYRAAIGVEASLEEGDTGAQPHATCRGVPALEDLAAIQAWQEADPFYNYVPFQVTAAGLEDDPSHWIGVVFDATDVDLTAESDIPAACADIGGDYVPADEIQTSTASLNSGYANTITTPLNAQIAQLQGDLAAAQAGVSAQSTVTAENASLKAEIAKLKTPLKAKLQGKISSSGATVEVTGPAGESVTVTATVKKSDKRTGLTAGQLGKASGKLGSNGKAQLKITLGSKAKKALKKAKGSRVSLNAVLTKASATATGKI